MNYKPKAWVYQISSGMWRITALDGCSTETSLDHRLFSARCVNLTSSYSPCLFLPWDAMLEMPQAVQTRSSMITFGNINQSRSAQLFESYWSNDSKESQSIPNANLFYGFFRRLQKNSAWVRRTLLFLEPLVTFTFTVLNKMVWTFF